LARPGEILDGSSRWGRILGVVLPIWFLASRWPVGSALPTRLSGKAGIAVRAGRGLYKLEKSVRRYCGHVRRTASQRGGEASLAKMRDERIRIAKEQADA
jgi:hypothetical protein